MYRYPALSLESILIDGFRASLKRTGILLNGLIVLSIMFSPFSALPARASGSESPGTSTQQLAAPSGQEGEVFPELTLPIPELEVAPTITTTQDIQQTAIPDPAPVALPVESAEVFPSPDPFLVITTTLPISETDIAEIPLTESPDSSPIYTEEITPTLQVEKPSLVEASGGQAIGMGGRVSLNIPQGAVQQALEVLIRPAVSLPLSARPPSGEPFEILAYRQDTRAEVKQFDRLLTIELVYDETHLRGDESTLLLVYYDEQKDDWIPLPTYVDVENNVVHATTDHLTVFDVTYSDWEGARLPSLQGFQVAPFTGAATYSLPIWAPPGPGGLQPNLELRYNSQMIDNSIAERSQASWVGMGWSLDTGSIERNMKGTPYNLEDDTFSISVGGNDSLLLKGEDGYYHTTDESFWRIERNNDTDSWIAWDKIGNVYYFGDSDNTRALYKTGFVCIVTPRLVCTIIMGAWRWSLHKIRNASGKELTFNYFEYTERKVQRIEDGDYVYWPDVWSYPSEIVYPNGHYRVVFDLEARTDYDDDWESANQTMLYQRYRLSAVRIMNDSQIMRRYNFSYSTTNNVYPNVTWDKGGKTLTLARVQEYGVGGATSLPATTFTYRFYRLSRGAGIIGSRDSGKSG